MIFRLHVNRGILVFLWFVTTTCLQAHAADVVYVDRPSDTPSLQQQTKLAAEFYGLESRVIPLTRKSDQSAILNVIRDARTVAVVLSANVLPSLNRQQILAGLRRRGARTIPLLIAGIDEHTDAGLVRQWSGGTVTGFHASTMEKGTCSYQVANVNGVTQELSGNKLPMNQSDVHYFTLIGTHAEWIMAAVSGTRTLPVFVRATTGGQDVFFATQSPPVEVPAGANPYQEPLVFTSLAPQMMFLRYAGGERVWHSPGSYANLTIDDAWLREPYGYLNYGGLLQEMEQHNFHTTIAFVPWNFDRSQPAVVSIFREHGDRFSICIHGNNHDHQEFDAYQKKPLTGQINDVKQSLARMEKFKELTRIPYDPVMVFPHSIAPEQTLGVLKRYNFWTTANSLNVPMGADAPADVEFALRTATMTFSNFPSLRRYSAEAPGPESQLAVDAFLGNPMLFYVHEGFFAPGIDAFDKTADTVNRLQPKTLWRSLGDIAKHLYLKRLRDDGNYDIRSYSGTILLRNDQESEKAFFVEKEEDFVLPLTVLVDGQPYPYQRLGTWLRWQVPIGKRSSREIEIRYTNDLNVAAIDISKRSVRIQAIRRLSDFRDDVVSRTALGRWFIRSYGVKGTDWNRGIAIMLGLVILLAVFWYMRRTERSRTSRRPPLPEVGNRV